MFAFSLAQPWTSHMVFQQLMKMFHLTLDLNSTLKATYRYETIAKILLITNKITSNRSYLFSFFSANIYSSTFLELRKIVKKLQPTQLRCLNVYFLAIYTL
jgi:hypothetical protein